MIPFIFIGIAIVFIMLGLSFAMKSYIIGILSAIAMIAFGIYVLRFGTEDINNILTMGIGCIIIGTGFYIFVGGSLEKILEF